MTMQLIETKTLGATAASIQFTSIPQDGTDLILKASVKTNSADEGNEAINIAFNGSTSSFSQTNLHGTGSGVASFQAGTSSVRIVSGGKSQFTNAEVYIPNYTSATNKSLSSDGVSENNATLAFQLISAGLWSDTAAITSIEITKLDGTNFLAESSISLYKITKGSDGIVTTS